MTQDVIKKIEGIKIIPVVVLHDETKAAPLADALCRGGLPCAEVTFRTEAAKEGIRLMRKAQPKMLVGAGTVLTVQQVEETVSAGAEFIVSPGLNPRTVRHCMERQIPILPGCSNPGDIEQALEFGLKVVKFFPSEPSGGLTMIKALSAPFHMVRFMPTGGISAENVGDYLRCPSVVACGGSWMVRPELIEKEDFDEIERLAREAARIAESI